MSLYDTVFLDRDGVIVAPADAGDYITRPDEVVPLPGAAAAVAALNRSGVFVVLVTNQRGVARGLMTEADVDAVNARVSDLLAEHGGRLDAVYVCPHETATCDCRKPAPGLLLRAAADHPDIDLGRAVMIGDTESDVLAGRAAGTATVRLAPAGERPDTEADTVLPDLAAAVRWLLGDQWPAASQSSPTPTDTSSGTDSA